MLYPLTKGVPPNSKAKESAAVACAYIDRLYAALLELMTRVSFEETEPMASRTGGLEVPMPTLPSSLTNMSDVLLLFSKFIVDVDDVFPLPVTSNLEMGARFEPSPIVKLPLLAIDARTRPWVENAILALVPAPLPAFKFK